ncbi:hypothetical protein BJ166DRAFT_532715 [Pestalotiopsis sp. NC0098]|nr:hypothetical protein BJ166DRAFT_532715 [Pestalotiopsis sp. NC0098]
MGNIWSQYFPPAASITEKNCPDQTGRVFLVTGGYAGVGFELCKILYAHNATIWIAGRSEAKAQKAIASMREASRSSKGSVQFLSLDLSDFATIKPAVELFTAKEQRLDVLVNNAGVMFPPEGSLDAQGNDLQAGTNCLGHYLLYQLLVPLLTKTAASSPTATVRVAWAGSIAVHISCPQPHGVVLNDDGSMNDRGSRMNYGQTKVGNVFLAHELAKQTPENGIVHASFNPGNLQTELQRHWAGIDKWITEKFFVYPAIFGAYTELFAAISPELTPAKSGEYIYPWGRFGDLPAGVAAALEAKDDVRASISARFVAWCGRQTDSFK